jgi:hypothetical protein
MASGCLLPSPGVPLHNPPGLGEALWPIPGSIVALLATYLYGAHRERVERELTRDSYWVVPGAEMGVTPTGIDAPGRRQFNHARSHG